VVALVYLLARDHVPLGKLEAVLSGIPRRGTVLYSNGWLAAWAIDFAARLHARQAFNEVAAEK
jgi:hypothetical protein